MRVVALIMGIASLSLAMTSIVHAQVCAYQDGGYCLSEIASQTAKKLGVPTETMVWEQSNWGEALWGGTAYLNDYENIWDRMVKEGKAATQDREKAFAEAKAAGGTKIGGVNLVVLSAATLQQLIDKNLMTKNEAQTILNNAKIGER